VKLGSVEVDESRPDVVVFTLVGEHDLTGAPALRAQFTQAVSAGMSIVVDLSPTAFLDSQVLHALVSAHEQAVQHGQAMLVVCPVASPAYRVFEITDLVGRMGCHAGLDEALAVLRGG
jgi:anti-anti-sigma factor